MTRVPLTDEQKGRICGVLAVGCDRETAVDFVGCTKRDLNRAMQLDPEFALHVRQTEAANEVAHMRSLCDAAKDQKNWRISVWWLEMRSPDRYKPRPASCVTLPQLEEFLDALAAMICDEIQCEEDQKRIIKRMADSIRELKDNVQTTPLFSIGAALPFEAAHASADFEEGVERGMNSSNDSAID